MLSNILPRENLVNDRPPPPQFRINRKGLTGVQFYDTLSVPLVYTQGQFHSAFVLVIKFSFYSWMLLSFLFAVTHVNTSGDVMEGQTDARFMANACAIVASID